ncbi:MAG: prepilin-type N-terminal cleavage/methylation domain-containing protein [Candidatus Cloacimonetes bacterium]|nr:prepilin-type N-terminal cleavage/methylation domain-containing protein [Candidatus Cloacimonadota bacterium]
MSRRCAHARRQGFTLLEVLVVMVIVAIAIMMAAPSIGRGLAQTRAQQAAATIAQDLQRAASLASRTNHPVLVRFDLDALSYEIVDRTDGTVYARQHFGANESELSLSSMTTENTTWVLYPNGTTAGNYSVNIRAGDRRHVIRMTRAGLIQVRAP